MSDLAEMARELYPVGADRVYVADDDRLAEFALEPWLKVLSDLFAAQAPEFVMFGATPIGEALAPRLAQRFGAGLITHALMMKVDDFDRCFIGRRAAYGGEYYEVLTTAGARSHFATVLPDTFGAPYPDASRYGEVETDRSESGRRRSADQNDRAGGVRAAAIEVEIREADRFGRAAGGRHRRGESRWRKRSARSWPGRVNRWTKTISAKSQVVGITGERVAPNLYVALGIRGDTMHTWGMKGARYVVAVHPDPDAPILKQADAALVGDPAKVAKELAEALSKN